MGDIIYCADAIVKHVCTGKFVIIERLADIPGLALPGGKKEKGENISDAVVREVREETGLYFQSYAVLGVYAEENRDPRGRYVSVVFLGSGFGTIFNEQGKTKVLLLSLDELVKRKNEFIFDHAKILEDFILHENL